MNIPSLSAYIAPEANLTHEPLAKGVKTIMFHFPTNPRLAQVGGYVWHVKHDFRVGLVKIDRKCLLLQNCAFRINAKSKLASQLEMDIFAKFNFRISLQKRRIPMEHAYKSYS